MSRKNPFFYYGGKVLSFVFSVFLLSLAAFYVARLAPGDPLVSYYGERAEKMTVQEREQAEVRLGLDQPIYVQYIRWLENALQGDFGISYKYKMNVLKVIAARLPNTLILGGTGLTLIFLGALALGAVCAWNEGNWLDRSICKAGTVVSCIPEFWLSLVLILVFAVSLLWLPSSGAYAIGGGGFADRAVHLVLPLVVTTAGHLWYYAYMIRNKLLEEIRADYVLLAKSKGLSRRAVLFRHCLRGVLPTYLSLMAISVPHILGGTYIVEAVFSYPGIGTLSYESARYQDYNLLMLLCVLSGGLVILCNILAQIVSERIDPRMRGGEPPEVTDHG